jgi:hypothetical protein
MEWRQNVQAMPKKLEDVVLEDRLPKLVLEMCGGTWPRLNNKNVGQKCFHRLCEGIIFVSYLIQFVIHTTPSSSETGAAADRWHPQSWR